MKKILKLIPFLIIVILFAYYSLFIQIGSIECVSGSGGCELVNVEAVNEDLPLPVYKAKKSVKSDLSNNNYIKDFSMSMKIPDKLVITVQKRIPEFALRSRDEESWYSIVGDNGLVISVEEETTLDYLYSQNLPNPGEFISEDIVKSYKIYTNVKPYFNISRVEIKEDGLLLESDNGYQALLPYDKDTEVLIGSILVVFNRLNTSIEESIMDNRDNQRISDICLNGCLVDFRFQNPVIKAKI